MTLRVLSAEPDGTGKPIDPQALEAAIRSGWVWIDMEAEDATELEIVAGLLGLDSMAISDAIEDEDHAKLDDFGDHLLLILHGLAEADDGDISTYELDCFLTETALVTVRSGPSRSVERLWAELQSSRELAHGGADQLLARLAAVLLRRWIAVVDTVEVALDELTERALEADQNVLREVTLLRGELGSIRRMARPQLQALGEVSRTQSSLVSEGGRRRFADARDAAVRVDQTLDSTRASLKDALDAYYGAQAQRATEVSRVLTIYAAILLPLSLVVGYYGMNTPALPGASDEKGWQWITALLVAIAVISLGVFVAVGWIRLPARRRTSGVSQAIRAALRAPAHVGGALYKAAAPTALRKVPSGRWASGYRKPKPNP